MAAASKIQVMISSRCNDKVRMKDGKSAKLTEIREKVAAALEEELLFEEQLFDVWTNENPNLPAADKDSWEKCMEQVRRSHILLVLYNGNAGWAGPDDAGGIGICHAELHEALASAPSKVRVINLEKANFSIATPSERDKRFADYVASQNRFYDRAETGDEVIEKSLQAVREAVADMVRLGKAEATRGRFHTGAALDWSRMSYRERKSAMECEAQAYFQGRRGASSVSLSAPWLPEPVEEWHIELEGRQVLFRCHAIPDAMSVSPARELVGQPFLEDYAFAGSMGNECVGPVHAILCHKNVTLSQAQKHLGFSDAIIVSTPFGIYVADKVHKAQMVFIRDCRDQYATRENLQRLFVWLDQTEEARDLSRRAEERKQIIDVVESVAESL